MALVTCRRCGSVFDKKHVAAQLQRLSESVAPANRLIALLNVSAQLPGLGPLPEGRLRRRWRRGSHPQHVGQILGTIGASDVTPGELPWRTEFGSLLHRLRHQKNASVLQELARVYVVDTVKLWEPRIVVTSVTVSRSSSMPRTSSDQASLRCDFDQHTR